MNPQPNTQGPSQTGYQAKKDDGSSQVVAAPSQPPGAAPNPYGWQTEADAYLSAAGWEKTGTDWYGRSVWLDTLHLGKKDELKCATKLPLQGGGLEVVEQVYCPPEPWTYSTDAAVAIQRQRDRNKESLEQQIARREEELKDLKSRLAEVNN